MRHEIKIPFYKDDSLIIKKFIKTTRGIVRHHKNRKINSIYFDTKDFQFARYNIEGISKRYKFRTRWYDDNFKEFKYEIKKKIDKLGSKSSYKNKKNDQISLEKLFTPKNEYLLSLLKNDEKFFIKTLNLKPILKVSYLREYYIYKNRVRLTLDHTPSYETIGKIKKAKQRDNYSVLEFKFEKENFNFGKKLIRNSFINPKRYSKYVKGLSLHNKILYY